MATDITPVWHKLTPETKQELLDFWKANNAVGDADKAALRAEQAVCVSREKKGGALTGVATAVVRTLPRLRQPMYYYRHFFAEAQRGKRQTKPFVTEAKKILQEYNASLPKPEALGILCELESKVLAEHYSKPYQADADFTFIGYSPRGFKLFVSYFDDAILLPPAPLPRRAGAGAGARQH